MTPRPPSPQERDLELLIASTATAHAAGVCGALLRDRIEARHRLHPGTDVLAVVGPGQFTEILATAERFKAAVLVALGDLEPGARVSAAQIAATAQDSARAALSEALLCSVGAERPAVRGTGLR